MDFVANAKVSILGTEQELKWEKIGNGFVAYIPKAFQNQPHCEYVWVLEIKK